jgi:hypothetical protein
VQKRLDALASLLGRSGRVVIGQWAVGSRQ